MKILFISHSSRAGGAENILLTLLKNLPQDKFELHCLFPAKGSLEEKVKSLGVKTYISDLQNWVTDDKNSTVKILDFCHNLKQRIENIINIIKANDIDLVITNTIVVGEGALAAKVVGIPHLWHIHEILSSDPNLFAPLDLKYFYHLILDLSDYVVVVSNAVKNEIEKLTEHASSKVKVIHNGIDVRLLDAGNPGIENIIFSAGYICKRKGFATLLESATYVNGVLPNAKFIVCGNVSEKRYYCALLNERKKRNLCGNFLFKGFQDDPYPLLRKASLVVVPSISEPFSTVLLEAMSIGKPVVATDCGGTAELMKDGETGFLVPVNDSKKMAEKIIYLLQNEKVAIKMGKNGYERVKNNFSTGKFIEKFIDIFEKIKSRRRKHVVDNSISNNIGMLIEIIDNFGNNANDTKKAFDLYELIINSSIYKIYKNLNVMKYPIRKLMGTSN